MFLTGTIRKGLLQLICYDEPCESCMLERYDCMNIPSFVLVCVVGENRTTLLEKYWTMPKKVRNDENIHAAFVYLSGVKME